MRYIKTYKLFESNMYPPILYHGTTHKFTKFNIDHARNGWLGRGFYFTDNKSFAKTHGKVITVTVDLQNPFLVQGNAPSDAYTEVNKKYGVVDGDLAISLKDNGYDGVIFNHWDLGLIVMCFSTDQIKIK